MRGIDDLIRARAKEYRERYDHDTCASLLARAEHEKSVLRTLYHGIRDKVVAWAKWRTGQCDAAKYDALSEHERALYASLTED